ncbi:MAG: DUF1080 domain-containing protein [Chitinophagaceae bacterium]|nr:DUF1080 domain-containing protein [Chitinophagaceae bacterium]
MIKSIVICFLISMVSHSFAQKTNEQWEYLFNGKDLKGWRKLNGTANYTVKNGEIVGTTVLHSPNTFLATEKVYGDFIFEVDFRVDDNMNSGIQFRSEIKDANDLCEVTDKTTPERVHGYQMEIDPSARAWSGGIYDEARKGWLYPMEYNPAAKTAFKQNQWNHYRIECTGNSIRTWVNGVACAHLIDDQTAKGFIALQVHQIQNSQEVGREIRWKNIRIQTKNLKPSPDEQIFVVNTIPNTISPEEKRNGVKLLWDGLTTKGWRGAYKQTFPGNIWYIKDGTLNVKASNGAESANGGDIVTIEEFHAFDLQFEFQLSDTANSGVKYFVTEKENNTGSAIGLEYQILDDDKHPDGKLGSIGNRTMASLYDLIPSKKIYGSNNDRRDKLPIGAWNRGRIVVYPDGRIEHWINGWKVVEYQRGTQYFFALVARSKYVIWPNFGMAEKGHILLQEHGTHVAFRSIKIKEL